MMIHLHVEKHAQQRLASVEGKISRFHAPVGVGHISLWITEHIGWPCDRGPIVYEAHWANPLDPVEISTAIRPTNLKI